MLAVATAMLLNSCYKKKNRALEACVEKIFRIFPDFMRRVLVYLEDV